MESLHTWVAARRVLPPSELESDLERMLVGNMTMIVLSKHLGEPVGFVQAHSFAGDWGWTSLLVYFDPERRTPGIMLEAIYLFVDYLFSAFPLRKLYADVFEYNRQVIRQLESVGFTEEGRFKEHVWYGDRYWSSIRLALFRGSFRENRDRVAELARIQLDIDGVSAYSPSPSDTR